MWLEIGSVYVCVYKYVCGFVWFVFEQRLMDPLDPRSGGLQCGGVHDFSIATTIYSVLHTVTLYIYYHYVHKLQSVFNLCNLCTQYDDNR